MEENKILDIILSRMDRLEDKIDKVDDKIDKVDGNFNSWKVRVFGFLTVLTAAMQGLAEILLRK